MNIQQLLDDALEIAVVPSFSSIGYSVRRRLFGWTPPPADAMRGKSVLITGPTSGLGRAATDALAGMGARIVLVGRDRDRLTAVRDDLIRAHGADRFPTVVADMASLTSVRQAVTRVLSTEPRLDVVIDNAGAIFPKRIESPDGFEATFATLVLGPFTLLAGLLPLLRSTTGARVVAVTSGGMYAQRLRLDDLQWEDTPFEGARAYAHAKRAQVALVREWARRVPASEVVVQRDAPGLGGHARHLRGAAAVLQPDGPDPADAGTGCRYNGLARRRSGRRRCDRARLPGSAATAIRPPAHDPCLRRRPHPVVGRGRRAHRRARSGPGIRSITRDPSTPSRSKDMTRIHERIATSLPIEATFDYVADFANSEQWDPGTTSSRRLDDGPLGPGARYGLTVRMGGRVAPMEYHIRDFDRPRRVVLVGSGSNVKAVDEIRFERAGDGTVVYYTADISLGGLLRLAEPFLGGSFEKIGRDAAAGMDAALEDLAARRDEAAS